jgi:hypothetical protein
MLAINFLSCHPEAKDLRLLFLILNDDQETDENKNVRGTQKRPASRPARERSSELENDLRPQFNATTTDSILRHVGRVTAAGIEVSVAK